MFTDVNVSFGHWPFQLGGYTDVSALKTHLAGHEISRALVSHLGAVFYPDADHYNRCLFEAVEGDSSLLPVPVLNLEIPGWEEHLHRYRQEHKITTVMILPSFHFFSMESPAAARLAQLLQDWNMPLLVRLRFEDERNQYRGLSVEGVPTGAVIRFHREHPELRLLCLNAYLPEIIRIGAETGPTLAFDFSFAERSNTIDTLLHDLPPERLFFGTHLPFLYTMSSILKVRHSNASETERRQIASENADLWFFKDR